jgi:hypothetical protein
VPLPLHASLIKRPAPSMTAIYLWKKGGINMIHTTAAKPAAYKAQCVQSHLVSYGRTRSCNERRENIDDARYAICTAKMLIRTNANPKKLFRRIHAGILSASKIDGN